MFKVTERPPEERLGKANDLNNLFNRFSSQPYSPHSNPPHTHTTVSDFPFLPCLAPSELYGSDAPPSVTNTLCLTVGDRRAGEITQGNTAGPDGISQKALRICAFQLSLLRSDIYSLILKLETVPGLLTTSRVMTI